MGAGCWCYLRWQVFVYKAIVYMLEKNGPITLTAVSKGHPPHPFLLRQEVYWVYGVMPV